MAEFTWIGTANSGSWYDPNNWRRSDGSNGVPGASDTATITSDRRILEITFVRPGNPNPVNPTVGGLNLFARNGGTLTLTGLTRYQGSNIGNVTIEAQGAGSRIDLSDVESLVGGRNQSLVRINALTRGEIDLSGLESINGGTTEITADGTGSLITLSNLTEFIDDGFDRSLLKVRNGGAIHAESLETLSDVDLLSDNSLLLLSALTTYRQDNNVRVLNGGQICLDQLEEVLLLSQVH